MASTLTDKMRDELRELKKDNRAKERTKQKRIKFQLERLKMEDDISAWKIITQVKQTIAQQLGSKKETKSYTIKHIAAFPDYYEYQHPNDAKKKGNSKDADWLKAFISGGGTEKQLMDAAAESRVKVWRRISWKRPRKATTTTNAVPAQAKNKTGAGGVG
jgi:hypothetical protein